MGLYLILIGVQGAGKGEQARFLSGEYGIPHVSTGDLFRAMRTRTDDFAVSIQQTMAAGKLIDDETTNAVVRERLSQPDAANGAILDGYPRTPMQADWFAGFLGTRGESLRAVMLFELDLFTAFKRAFGRVSTPDEKKSYNIYYNADGLAWSFEDHPEKAYPPRLVATAKGETLKRRPDDANAHAIIKRIDLFLEQTAPLIAYYRDKGLLHTIDAVQPIADVSDHLRRLIDTKTT
ncbi:MAG: nucleoside monophosphate kinase [Chloroflexota bacterium]|nr:nucleoside monophosphate kinase [Chloroflexota bacterium]